MHEPANTIPRFLHAHEFCEQIGESIAREIRFGKKRFECSIPSVHFKRTLVQYLVRRLRWKTIILAPNKSVQAHWLDRNMDGSHTMEDVALQLWGSATGHLVSAIPFSCAPILPLTIHSLTENDDASRLARHLVKFQYRLVVVDECPALTEQWSQLINELQRSVDTRVIVLRSAESSEDDFQIPFTSIVRDGYAVPVQCLVQFTRVDDEIRDSVREINLRLRELLRTLSTEHLELHTMDFWIHHQIRQNGEQASELRTVFQRYIHHHVVNLFGKEVQAAELHSPIALRDYVVLLKEYDRQYLSIQNSEEAERRSGELNDFLHSLMANGQLMHNDALRLHPKKTERVLEILRKEQRDLSDRVRALVIVEDAGVSSSNHDFGEGDDSTLTGYNLLQTFLQEGEVGRLHPVLCTGSTFLCQDDLVIPLLAEAQHVITQHGYDITITHTSHTGVSELYGEGGDWNSKTYRMVGTALLERGITRCMIGEGSLFESGWERTNANVLIDLSERHRGYYLNQPEQPFRAGLAVHGSVVNHWDVIAVCDESPAGYADYEWFRSKHEAIVVPNDDGLILRGVGHVHPKFIGLAPKESVEHCESLNSTFLKRAGERERVFKQWAIGQETGSVSRDQAVIVPHEGATPALQFEGPQRDQLEWEMEQYRERVHAQKLHYTFAITIGIGAMMSALLFLPNVTGAVFGTVILASMIGYITVHWMRLRYMKPSNSSLTNAQFILKAAKATLAAMSEIEPTSDIPRETALLVNTCIDGTHIVVTNELSPELSHIFASVFRDIFFPIYNQRYFLHSFRMDVLGMPLRSLSAFDDWSSLVKPGMLIPVPARFSERLDHAELFLKHFSATFGRMQLISTDLVNGAQYVRGHEGMQFYPSMPFVVQVLS